MYIPVHLQKNNEKENSVYLTTYILLTGKRNYPIIMDYNTVGIGGTGILCSTNNS